MGHLVVVLPRRSLGDGRVLLERVRRRVVVEEPALRRKHSIVVPPVHMGCRLHFRITRAVLDQEDRLGGGRHRSPCPDGGAVPGDPVHPVDPTADRWWNPVGPVGQRAARDRLRVLLRQKTDRPAAGRIPGGVAGARSHLVRDRLPGDGSRVHADADQRLPAHRLPVQPAATGGRAVTSGNPELADLPGPQRIHGCARRAVRVHGPHALLPRTGRIGDRERSAGEHPAVQ